MPYISVFKNVASAALFCAFSTWINASDLSIFTKPIPKVGSNFARSFTTSEGFQRETGITGIVVQATNSISTVRTHTSTEEKTHSLLKFVLNSDFSLGIENRNYRKSPYITLRNQKFSLKELLQRQAKQLAHQIQQSKHEAEQQTAFLEGLYDQAKLVHCFSLDLMAADNTVRDKERLANSIEAAEDAIFEISNELGSLYSGLDHRQNELQSNLELTSFVEQMQIYNAQGLNAIKLSENRYLIFVFDADFDHSDFGTLYSIVMSI